MELKVKDLKRALENVNDEIPVYLEASFGGQDIHVAYSIVLQANDIVVIKGDGHLAQDDRIGTLFDLDIPETSLLEE